MRDADFETLYANHAQPLFGFLVYRTGDRALAEDVLADAFERAYRARGGFDRRKAKEKTWLYKIALNAVSDHQRRVGAEARAYERAMAGAPSYGTGGLATVEDRATLDGALSRLTPEEREVVSLRFGAELTVPEITRLLGAKLTTIEGRLYRALRKLRDELEPDDPS